MNYQLLFNIIVILYECINCISWIHSKNNMWLNYNITTVTFWIVILTMHNFTRKQLLDVLRWPYELVIFLFIIPIIIWGVYIFIYSNIDTSFICIINIMNFILTSIYAMIRIYHYMNIKQQQTIYIQYHLSDNQVIFNPVLHI